MHCVSSRTFVAWSWIPNIRQPFCNSRRNCIVEWKLELFFMSSLRSALCTCTVCKVVYRGMKNLPRIRLVGEYFLLIAVRLCFGRPSVRASWNYIPVLLLFEATIAGCCAGSSALHCDWSALRRRCTVIGPRCNIGVPWLVRVAPSLYYHDIV